MFKLRSAALFTLLLASSLAENELLAPRQAPSGCLIMPIAPQNNLIPCGSGSLVEGCQCCFDLFGCDARAQSCGPLGCNDNLGYFGCGAGQQPCGTGCIADGDVCCGSGGSYCLAGSQCDDATDKCVPNGSGTTGSDTAPGAPGLTAGLTAATHTSTPTTAVSGQGASQAASRSGSEVAFGWKVTTWALLATEAILFLLTWQ
jgi:hypothetical protein